MEKRFWPRTIVLPVVLIVVGLGFLLSNLGFVPWNVWEVIWRLWPVWLVAIGLDLLIGRGSRMGAMIVTAVTVLLLVGGVALLTRSGVSTSGPAVLQVDESASGASQASVELRPSVGRLTVRGGAESGVLIQGEARRMDGESLRKNSSKSGDTAIFSLESEHVWMPRIGNQIGGSWDLALGNSLPTSLSIHTGVGDSRIDLADTQVTRLDLSTGVGQTLLTLPRQGQVQAVINTGVGQTTITIPAGMAARISVRQGVGHIAINGDYQQRGELYTSPGYSDAKDRVDLTVSGGVGEVRILQGN